MREEESDLSCLDFGGAKRHPRGDTGATSLIGVIGPGLGDAQGAGVSATDCYQPRAYLREDLPVGDPEPARDRYGHVLLCARI